MREYGEELKKRTEYIREILKNSGADGIVYGNSGGKDSALVGALCKAACSNTLGIIMPCDSKRNFSMDKDDGLTVAEFFHIETRVMDITPIKRVMKNSLNCITELSDMADVNINPRLRMTALYAVAASEKRLVAGTGNRSEAYLGYFTKWGDGACDFNPISDLTVTEIYEFLEYLNCPECVINKAPSAGLFDGQTDEEELGISYSELDNYLLHGTANEKATAEIERRHSAAEHKLTKPSTFMDR